MESTPEQAAEGKALVTVLACVLDNLIQANANSGHDRLEAGSVTKFHALRPPGIGVAEYLDRILKYSSCSNECFVLGLIYMDRFIQRNDFALTALNVHRVAITSVMVAAKFFDDQYYNNAYYAKVGGVPCTEINSLEIEFLFGLDFNLAVTGEEFGIYRERLVEHANCSACGCSTGILKRQRAINPATSTSSPMLSDLGRDGRASASPGPIAQGYASGWPKPRDGSDDPRAPGGDHRQKSHRHGDMAPELITPAAVLGSNHQPSIQRATNDRVSGGGIAQGNGGVSGMCAPVGTGRGEVGAGGGGGGGVGGVGVAHQGVFDPEAAVGLERQLQQQMQQQHQAQDHQQQLQMQQQHQAQDHQQQLQMQQQQQTQGQVGYRRLHQHQNQQQQQQQQVLLDREAVGAETLLSIGVNDSLFEDARGHHQVQRPLHQPHQSAPQQQFFGQQEQQQQHHHRHQASGGFTAVRPGGAAAAATTVDGSSGRMATQDVSVSVSTTTGGSMGGRAPGQKHALNTGGGGGPVASQRFRITPSPERALPLRTSSSGVGLNMAAFAGGSEGGSSGSGGSGGGMEVTSSSAFGSTMTTTVCGDNGGNGNGGFGGYGGGGLPLPPGHARRGSTGGAVRGMSSGDLAVAVMSVSAASMAPAGGAMEGGFSAVGSGLGGLCKGEVMGLRGGSDGGAMVAPHVMGGGLGAGMYDGGGGGAGMEKAGARGGESVGGGILFGKQQLQLRRQQQQQKLLRIRPTQQQQQQPRPHRLHAAAPPPPHPNHQHHPPHQHHHQQSHQHHLGLSVAAMEQVQAAFAAGRPTASCSHAGPPERGPFSAGGMGACGGNGINGGGGSGGGAGFTVSSPRYRDVAGGSVSGNGDLMIGDTLVNGNYFADVGGGMGGGGLASGNCSGLHAAAGSYYDHNRHHVSAGAGAGAGANAFGLGANSIVGNGVGPHQAAHHHAGRGHRPRNASANCGNFPLSMAGGDGGDGGVGILVGGGPGGFPLDVEAAAEARKRQDDGMSVSTPPSGTAGLDGGGGYFESVPPSGLGGGSVVGTGGGGRAGGMGGDLYSPEGDEVFYTPQRVRTDGGYGFPHNRAAGFGGGGGGGVGSDGSIYLTPRSTTSHMEGEASAGDGRAYAHQCLDPSISYTTAQDLSRELEGFDVGLDRRQPARTGLSGAVPTGGPQGTGVGWPLDTGRETWSC